MDIVSCVPIRVGGATPSATRAAGAVQQQQVLLQPAVVLDGLDVIGVGLEASKSTDNVGRWGWLERSSKVCLQ